MRWPWPCSQSLKLAYIASKAFIALAYMLIAVGLHLLWRKRRQDINHAGMLLGFVAFRRPAGGILPEKRDWLSRPGPPGGKTFAAARLIVASAVTHVCDITVLWWPAYRLYTLFDLVTAIVSVGRAMVFPWVVHMALQAPTPERFRRVNDELRHVVVSKDRAINDLNETIGALRRQVDHLERMRQTGLWVAEQESALRELRSVLQSSFAKAGPR